MERIQDEVHTSYEEVQIHEEAQALVEQVLEEVQNSESPHPDESQDIARVALSEALTASIVPEEYWQDIVTWVTSTGIDQVYLDSRDRIGAWWVARELQTMGYALNFTKCGIMPSLWYPEGEHWKEAEAQARYQLVASWKTFVANEALDKIES